jgi:murein DD-endopeptidase MepM/ murein hydrolase activator NlpD
MMIKLLLTGFASILLTTNTATVNAQPSNLSDTVMGIACLPLQQLRLTSGFGWRIHPITGKFQFHKGVDLAARHDTVVSILDGVISQIGYNRLIGNYILISHPGDVESLYGHLSVIAALPGEQVTAGQSIGVTGATGRVTGEHLHFSIKYRGRELSPLAFLGGLFAKPP